MNATAESRVKGLDGLRGVAILAVLFSHLTVYEGSAWLTNLAELGSRGVDLFFALSGYLIFERLQHVRNQPGWLQDFWLRRAAKIVPVYAFVLLGVYVVLPPLLGLTGFSTKPAAQIGVLGDWPWYATFTSNVLNIREGRFLNPAIDVAWSLAVEVQFYLLATLAFVVRRNGGPKSFWLLLALFALLVRLAAVAAGFNWIQILACTPARLDAFIAGIALVFSRSRLPRWLQILGLGGLAMCALPPWSREGLWGMTIGYSWVALGCAVLIDLARQPAATHFCSRVLTGRFLCIVGALSYTLYLVHVPIRAALRDLLLPPERILDSTGAWLNQGLFYAGAGLICLLCAALGWCWIEKPVRRWMLRTRAELRL
ncbi:MAG TPA: acyltransferase [Opitutaceae bacterium]|nr:acyltransferase [Opitutaceae bacterium]HRJ45745.1 acyltransferase [Opitutaceae bacterium]